jgi:hypothetical protein
MSNNSIHVKANREKKRILGQTIQSTCHQKQKVYINNKIIEVEIKWKAKCK